MKKKILLLYYTALILIMILFPSTSSAPIVVRLGYLVALLLPLTMNVQFFPAVFVLTLAISQNSFAYPLVPDGTYYISVYVIIALLFAILSFLSTGKRTTITRKNQLSPFFVFLCSYLAVINLLLEGKVLGLTASVFICVMLYICACRNLSANAILLSLAFMVFSLALCYWIIFHPEARVVSAHGEEALTWADPNYLGGMAGIGCVIAILGLLYAKKSFAQMVLCILTIVGSLFFLARMSSRGAIMAVGTSSVALVLLSDVKRSTKILSFLGILFAIVIVYYSVSFDVLISRFAEEDMTGTGRTLIWRAKLNGFGQEDRLLPILFGFGKTKGALLGISELGRARAAHNDFVAVLVEYGITGLVLFVTLLLYPIRIAKKKDKPVIAALLLFLVTLGMTIEPIMSGRFVYVAFYLYIIVLSKSGILKESEKL